MPALRSAQPAISNFSSTFTKWHYPIRLLLAAFVLTSDAWKREEIMTSIDVQMRHEFENERNPRHEFENVISEESSRHEFE